jgi:hypothetical protein
MSHPNLLRHPNEVQLALFAGGDLGLWERWKIGRHVARCSTCHSEVAALRAAGQQVQEALPDLPKDVNWSRLAEEMRGNIRVGLAAGEAIARFDRPVSRVRPARLGWNAALVLACASAVFVAAFWTSLPGEQAQHLTSALRKIFTGQTGRHPAVSQDDAMLQASSSAIEVKENGRTMMLTHPRSDGVTVTVSMRGSAGVRYVDDDTGQVTTNKVYYAEQ